MRISPVTTAGKDISRDTKGKDISHDTAIRNISYNTAGKDISCDTIGRDNSCDQRGHVIKTVYKMMQKKSDRNQLCRSDVFL